MSFLICKIKGMHQRLLLQALNLLQVLIASSASIFLFNLGCITFLNGVLGCYLCYVCLILVFNCSVHFRIVVDGVTHRFNCLCICVFKLVDYIYHPLNKDHKSVEAITDLKYLS